jgi:hypothetical protein
VSVFERGIDEQTPINVRRTRPSRESRRPPSPTAPPDSTERGVGMSQRVRVDGLSEARGFRRMTTSQVDGFGLDGPGAVRGREQPFAGALRSPIPAQQLQEFRRKQGLSVPATFSLPHPQCVAASVYVTSFKLGGLGYTEAGAVQHGQNGAVAKLAGGFE